MKSFLLRIKNGLKRRIKNLIRGNKNQDAQFDRVIAHFIGMEKIPAGAPCIIFDIGAHQGETVKRFAKLCPGSQIHAFEPDLSNFERLEINTKDQAAGVTLSLNNQGVSGENGSLTFYRNMKSNTSSFHPVNTASSWAQNRAKRHNVSPEEYTEKSYDVPVISVDNYCKDRGINHVHILKMDTQGHEDEVLKGAQKLLELGAVDIVETELIVGDAYQKSLQFYDLERILVPYGFKLYAIDRAGDLLATPSLSFNALYVHQRLL